MLYQKLAGLAQWTERETLNLGVVGLSFMLGEMWRHHTKVVDSQTQSNTSTENSRMVDSTSMTAFSFILGAICSCATHCSYRRLEGLFHDDSSSIHISGHNRSEFISVKNQLIVCSGRLEVIQFCIIIRIILTRCMRIIEIIRFI